MKNKTVRITFIVFSLLLLSVVLVLFLLALRQEIRYNRVLAEYEASRLSAELTEIYLSGQEVNLDAFEEKVLGFAVYNEAGIPVFTIGETPEATVTAHPGGYGDLMYRNGDRITVIRASGRGRMRQDKLPGPAAGNRIITILMYNLNSTRGSVSMLILLTAFLFVLFIVLLSGIAVLYRRINRIKAEENKNLQLIRLGQAARVLTHEIKNPLGVIRIQQNILKKKLPDEFRNSLAVIGEETARIARLTDRVGDFLKHPEGTPQKIDLSTIVSDLIRTKYSGITPEILTETAFIFIDPDNLRSILENLLINAIQSGGTEENITVMLEKVKRGYSLSVADRGTGIPPDSADRIFDLFYTTRTTGSGIGLAVARSFSEAAGGFLTAGNRAGGGAVFTLFLPEHDGT